jgi:hypothetical protein
MAEIKIGDADRMVRLAQVVSRFREMKPDQAVAAYATNGGGIGGVTYGDLAELLRKLSATGERLARIGDWHSRESGPGGTVGDYCTECGVRWPCDTRRMAEGTYVDEEER